MTDDLFERYAQSAALAAAKEAFERGLELGQQQGFAEGLATGRLIGFVEGVNSLKAAVSDGTRHGSSECGRALESMKRLGAIADDEPDLDD